MTRFYSDADDLTISGEYPGVYATARATGNISNDGSQLWVGQNFYSNWYAVKRAFLRFDTSAIPDGDTVTDVTLGLMISSNHADAAFDVYCYMYDWLEVPDGSFDGEPNESLRDAVFDMGIAGSRTSTAAVKETAEVTMDAQAQYDVVEFTGLTAAWVDKTGYTYYALRSSEDVDNSAPTGEEYVIFYHADMSGTAYDPYLDIVHGAATGTRISRIYASGVICESPLQQF